MSNTESVGTSNTIDVIVGRIGSPVDTRHCYVAGETEEKFHVFIKHG